MRDAPADPDPVHPETPARARPAARDPAWVSPEGEPPAVAIGPIGWLMVAWRLPLMSFLVLAGLLLHLSLRLIERPLFGLRRPVTPFVWQAVCKVSFALLMIRLRRHGAPMQGRGAVVANHASWLDIFAINAMSRVYFVSKAEVAGWPVIGWLARATGTVFINRDAREARLQKELFEARLRVGHHLCFFPEGTSTDGVRMLPFKPTLFAAFFTHGLAEIMQIQPVSIVYRAPDGQDARFYGWFGSMGFFAHLLGVMSMRRQGRIDLVFHPPVVVADFSGRKELALHCERAVREGLVRLIPPEHLRD